MRQKNSNINPVWKQILLVLLFFWSEPKNFFCFSWNFSFVCMFSWWFLDSLFICLFCIWFVLPVDWNFGKQQRKFSRDINDLNSIQICNAIESFNVATYKDLCFCVWAYGLILKRKRMKHTTKHLLFLVYLVFNRNIHFKWYQIKQSNHKEKKISSRMQFRQTNESKMKNKKKRNGLNGKAINHASKSNNKRKIRVHSNEWMIFFCVVRNCFNSITSNFEQNQKKVKKKYS